MKIQTIDSNFSVSPQIAASDLKALAAAGYKAVLCARPDGEDAGQPDFAEIDKAAQSAGLKAFHIPVSGPLGEGQLIRFEQMRAEVDGPILGYCRSGGRAASLHAADAASRR